MPLLERLRDQLKYRVFRVEDRDRMRVFGIGLPKTGTTSLTDAMTVLGMRSIHYPPCFELTAAGLRFRWPWWLNKYDCFADIPVARFYPEIDQRGLRSRFVLTIRDVDSWLGSCRKHFSPERHRADVANPSLRPAVRLTEEVLGSSIFDDRLYAAAYRRHVESVRSYFRDRDDLLVLDLCGGEGWEKLCPFLGIDVPEVAFPRSNAAAP